MKTDGVCLNGPLVKFSSIPSPHCSWFLSILKSAMMNGCTALPYPAVLTDATMEKLALTKFVCQESHCEVCGVGIPITLKYKYSVIFFNNILYKCNIEFCILYLNMAMLLPCTTSNSTLTHFAIIYLNLYSLYDLVLSLHNLVFVWFVLL